MWRAGTRMAWMTSSRARLSVAVTTAIVLLMSLTACFAARGDSVDTDAVADAITATSESVEVTYVETSLDGLTTSLWVNPLITTDSLTSHELDSVLQVAFTMTQGVVESIEVRTEDARTEQPVDVSAAATELGIHFVTNINSITYSTNDLSERYGS